MHPGHFIMLWSEELKGRRSLRIRGRIRERRRKYNLTQSEKMGGMEPYMVKKRLF